jgi:NADH:ubiquinone oxidoreductase subunit 6 (subunit J)
LSADYLAILFVLIYGGAISILIMFVIMMLDLKELELKISPVVSFLKTVAFLITVCFLLFFIFTENVESHIPSNVYYKD